jgi:PAS domain S-box-containing protein/putative nucleotidyltransferase with HDIG domain
MDRQMPAWLVIGFSAVLFAGIFALRIAFGDAGGATMVLLVIPIAVCAMEFGLHGGLGAAAFSLGLVVGYDAIAVDEGIGSFGIATEVTAFLIVGGLLGIFVDGRRKLEAQVERHFDLSLDLFGAANFDGYFVELNPAWEETLGYCADELCSRPFVEFIHPDDRERSMAEMAKNVEGIETVNFRNRFRRADGEYLWLEWNIRPLPEEQRLYATARDITTQHQAEVALQNQSDVLEMTVRERTEELEESRLETLQRLAITAEYRDDATYQHTERVGRTAALIARRLGLSEDDVALIRRAAPLHDIGKVGIPDVILLKPGPLDPDEWELMRQHTEMGARILGEGTFPVLRAAQEITLNHHERWDGRGYPNGLAGEDIPLFGRIVAVADVFDALTHQRPYKAAWPIEAAIAEIERCRGSQFDPMVVDAFTSLDHRHLLEDVAAGPDVDAPSLAPAGYWASHTYGDVPAAEKAVDSQPAPRGAPVKERAAALS